MHTVEIREWPRYCRKVYWTKMVQNGPNDHFGRNDLIPNRILAFAARPKWLRPPLTLQRSQNPPRLEKSKEKSLGKSPRFLTDPPKRVKNESLHFGLKGTILVHLGPPTVLWPLLTNAVSKRKARMCNIQQKSAFGLVWSPSFCPLKRGLTEQRQTATSA